MTPGGAVSGFIVSLPNTVASGIMPATHSGNELELTQDGKWLPYFRRRCLPHLLRRPGRATDRAKRDIRARRIAGIAPLNDTLGDVVCRGLRSANSAQERHDNF